ncbi:YALIH222S04e10528g1_1 [Yarrowia lipolytica]|nr:YALIH222S04e10528g1_1 [Yarrowia lipolytica]
MSPTRFPKMNKEPAAPPVPTRPTAVAAPVKHIAVTFEHSSRMVYGNCKPTPNVKVFPESELCFTRRQDIDEFYQKYFADKSFSSIKNQKLEVSTSPHHLGYQKDTLPFTAILSTDLHPRMKNAQAWFIMASSDLDKSTSTVEIQEVQRMIAGLRRDLENEKIANAALIKEVKSRAARKAEKIASAKVEELTKTHIEELEKTLMASVNLQLDKLSEDRKSSKTSQKTTQCDSSTSPSSSSCSMSFKLADVGVYPLTDGSGQARIVGKLPAHVGAMLLALDKLPEIRNINGTVAAVKNTGSCLELMAQIKFSQWSNEWLCSWGDNVKVAPKFAVESSVSKCPQPSLITTLSEANPTETSQCRVPLSRSISSNSTSSTKSTTYTPTCAVPLASRLSKTSPTNPPRAFPVPVSAPLCQVPLSRPSVVSPRIGCFKEVPPGLSGAQEEIPWTIKVDTPSAKPDPHPVSESDAFVCDYCLEPISEARFHCQSCVDFDVCSSCYPSRAKSHAQKHGFVQLDVKTGIPIDTETSASSSSGDISTSSVRFPVLNSVSSSTTVGVNTTEERHAASDYSSRSSARSGHSGLSSRSQSQSSFADVTVDDLLSDIGSYEHVTSDYPDYSDFEEHF